MPVPTNISELSTTAGSNSPPGSEASTTVDDYLRAQAAFIAQLRDGKVSTTGTGATGTWGISITGSAASATTATTATTATNATQLGGVAAASYPQNSRTISTAGLATGGGDLSANRTITVTASSQAEAEAGVNTTTAMTPQRTAQALTAQLPAANAALAAGSVGTYAFCQQVSGTAAIGDTVAGSNLRYTDRSGGTNTVTIPTGTWRCMGNNSVADRGTVWLRIA